MKDASRDKSHFSKKPEPVKPVWEACTDLSDIADYIGTADVEQIDQALLDRGICVRLNESEEARVE